MAESGRALVTGGAVRLGAAIVERLARAGFAVAIHCHRSEGEAQALATRLRAAFGVETCVVTADLAGADLDDLVDAARRRLGRPLTLLVNSASVYEADLARNFDSAGFDRHMHINLRAPLLLSQHFAAQAPHGSAIVNLLDQRVLRPTPRQFTYTLSKAALHTATRTLAQAFAPRIRVNGVAPGLTLANANQDAADYARRIETLPLQTGGSPAEVAEAVLFLSQARSVTGQVIAVDGGQHLAWETPDSATA